MLPVIFLMGATAVGKSDLAIALCRRYAVEIISVDSAMVYKGMDIGTGKPSKSLLQEVPHYLVDICDIDERYSACQFRSDALRFIEQIHAKQRVPLLVGGTNLYFHVLNNGLAAMPYADQAIRQRLTLEAGRVGWSAMHQRLSAVDSKAAMKIHPNDAQRIQRALEVYEISGRGITEHYNDSVRLPLPFEMIKVILAVDDRRLLKQRIKQRFLRMLDDGLVDEVSGFYHSARCDKPMPAMNVVGYKQVWDYLDGRIDYVTMVDKAIIATRQLAKRQMTWLRKQYNDAHVVNDAASVDDILQQIAYL